MNDTRIKIAIFEDHQGIIDGYLYRLSPSPTIEFVGNVMRGDELEPFLDAHPVDVLIMDLNVPTSVINPVPYPVLYAIPSLLKKFPALRILVISVSNQSALVEALMNAGVRGYICKDDTGSIQTLAQVVDVIAGGGTYFSDGIFQKLQSRQSAPRIPKLTRQQQRLLSLCIIFPDIPTDELASKMGRSNSTVRNTLSRIYSRMGVHSRTSAIVKAQSLGLIGKVDVQELKPENEPPVEE